MKIKKYDSINVIPFIDVLLVLLTIVLMTSTFISKGIIPVSLPKSTASDELKPNKEILLSIKQNGEIYVGKEKKSIEELSQSISNLNKKEHILINSDKNAKFEVFVTVLDLLKSNNLENISIVTKNE